MAILQSGAIASHFALLGLDGREYTLPGDLESQPAVIVFFRTGCPTCDIAFPYINQLREAYPEGWRLWAVSQDAPEKAGPYAEKYGLTYPVLIDAPALMVSRAYDPPSTPTLYLVGADGRVEYTSEGFAKDDLNELSRRIAAHLGAAPIEIAPADDGVPAMKPGCMARHLFPARRA